jgi:hypothetical protein
MTEDTGHAASAILAALAAHTEESIPVGAVVSTAGSRVHGLAILLFALPDALPLPIPSVSAIIGLPLLFISLHLAIFGDDSRLPARVEAARIPRPVIAAIARYLTPPLTYVEHLSRPRWLQLVRQEHLIGAVCVYLSAILLLPIPFLNMPPALCLAVIGLGMVQRDGMLIAAGFGGAVLTTAALVGVIQIAGSFFGR